MKSLRDRKIGNQFAYIFDEVLTDDWLEGLTDEEKAKTVYNEIVTSKSYELKKYGLQCATESFLRGLGVNIDYIDYNIEQIGKKWGFCKNQSASIRFVNNWWSCISFRFVQIFRFYNLIN